MENIQNFQEENKPPNRTPLPRGHSESHPAGTPTFTSQTTASSTTASFSVPLIGSGHQIAAQSYRQTRWKAQEKKVEE